MYKKHYTISSLLCFVLVINVFYVKTLNENKIAVTEC